MFHITIGLESLSVLVEEANFSSKALRTDLARVVNFVLCLNLASRQGGVPRIAYDRCE